jgi:hypothetical protein
VRVHRRLGGGWFSRIYVRYILRRAFGPAWPARLKIQGLRQRLGATLRS